MPDREGVLAELTTLAGDLGINIYDIEIAHSAEGPRGVLVLVVASGEAARLRTAVLGRRLPRHGPGAVVTDRPAPGRGDGGTLVVTGARRLAGRVSTPGDKSISHRALLIGALAEGTSVVRGLSDGEDVAHTAAAVAALGAEVTRRADGVPR